MPHSLELNGMKLYRKVQGQDLCAREAQFHSTCHNAFKLRHVNLSKQSSTATTAATPSFLSLRTEAHSTALSNIVGYLQKHIIIGREIVELYSLRRMNTWKNLVFQVLITNRIG